MIKRSEALLVFGYGMNYSGVKTVVIKNDTSVFCDDGVHSYCNRSSKMTDLCLAQIKTTCSPQPLKR
jgi:hypothetical protein